MKQMHLIASSIRGGGFRSIVVVLSALVLASSTLMATVIVRGAEEEMILQQARLGADIVVIPESLGGEPAPEMEPMEGMDRGPVGGGVLEGALFTGKLAEGWMPEGTLQAVSSVSGVQAASAQLYVGSMGAGDQDGGSGLFLVAYDPSTDFVLGPWLGARAKEGLGPKEAFGGSQVSVPAGAETIRAFGYDLHLKGSLEVTGTKLDRTLFFSFETARELVAAAQAGGGCCCMGMMGMAGMAGMAGMTGSMEPGLSSYCPMLGASSSSMDHSSPSSSMASMLPKAPAGSISAVVVRVAPGRDIRKVANQIFSEVPGVAVAESYGLYQSFRNRLSGLIQGSVVVLSVIWIVSVLVIALVFSVVVSERKREIAVLRALGSTRLFVLRSLLAEASMLAISGALLGGALAGAAIYGLRAPIADLVGTSYHVPSLEGFLIQVNSVLGMSLAAVLLAALLPVLRASRLDPALAMRE